MSRKMMGKVVPTIVKVYGKDRARYLELVSLFPLRPIDSEDHLDAATRVIDMLLDLGKRSKAEEDYLDVLSDLTVAYEDQHHPVPDVPDFEMLKYLMELKEYTQADVATGAGIAVSTVSEVLSGKRKLNRKQIGKLAKFFKVSPAVFDFPG